MNRRVSALAAALAPALLAPASAHAGILVFEDTFDAENTGAGALDYAAFNQWTVTDGAVDLIGNGFFDYFPGNGLYIDLDGSIGNAGLFSSTPTTLFPGDYVLEFELGGRIDGGANSVDVSVGNLFVNTLTRNANDPLAVVTIPFTVTSAVSASINFQDLGNDNFGLILDDVRLTLVPTPASALLCGMAGLGALRRRR